MRQTKTAPPLRRVLVPVDFSKNAEHALRRALLLPLAPRATLSVLHVVPPGLSAKLRARAWSDADRALTELVARASARHPEQHVSLTPELLTGEPFVEIIRRARQLRSELIVMGRRGARSIRGMVLGTTAERVVRKGDVPVLVVRSRPTQRYRRPLIATDLEDSAPRTFDLALRVLGSEVETVHVVHAYHVPFEGLVTPTLTIREVSGYRRSYHARARAGLESMLAERQGRGPRWSGEVAAGDARGVILAAAARRRADLIALGTHGRSGLARALVGSVAEYVIHAARCDVLVSRPVRFSFALP